MTAFLITASLASELVVLSGEIDSHTAGACHHSEDPVGSLILVLVSASHCVLYGEDVCDTKRALKYCAYLHLLSSELGVRR